MTARVRIAFAVALALAAGCSKHEEQAPAGVGEPRPTMAVSEVKRGQDACKAYVDKVCACAATVADRKHDCELAKSLPDALQVALDVSKTDDTTRKDVVQANDSVRKIVKECIEETAKLANAGCP